MVRVRVYCSARARARSRYSDRARVMAALGFILRLC